MLLSFLLLTQTVITAFSSGKPFSLRLLVQSQAAWTTVFGDNHTTKPLWVKIWFVYTLLLISTSFELLWGSFSLWCLQNMFCDANAADALLQKRYAGPSIFGKGCEEVTTFLVF